MKSFFNLKLTRACFALQKAALLMLAFAARLCEAFGVAEGRVRVWED